LSNNTATARVSVVDLAAADLSIVKRAGADQVGAGDGLTYTLSITNAGPATAQAVTLTDQLPAQVSYVNVWGDGWLCEQAGGVVTCTRPDLSLASTTVTLTVTAPLSTGTITNTAEITSASPDWNTANNSSAVATQVIQLSHIFLPLIIHDSSP
jgi:large repetitive protein